jgi:phosphoribosylamine--glycine ligase
VKVLLVGSGGREHALAWKFSQEEPGVEVIAAPGNAGIAEIARCVQVAATDLDTLAAVAEAERVDLTVVGPEAPLALGIVDRFRERHLPIFGPVRGAAAIESSKVFAKELMANTSVPTARAERHSDPQAAKRAVRDFGAPVVIKASGLAAGKGVVVAETIAQADEAVDAMLVRHAFGLAGSEILVEEYMQGEEVSLLFLTNGTDWLPFVAAQDHKRLLDGDHGPNTGGMGAYAPVYPVVLVTGDERGLATHNTPGDRRDGSSPHEDHWADWNSLVATVAETIVEPMLAALRDLGSPFTGVLYAGLMLTDSGPRVVEFNCRMGDPETQAILPLTRFALLPLMRAVAAGDTIEGEWRGPLHRQYAVATVLATAGYPDRPRTGDVIRLPQPEPGVHVFHAGTTRNAAGDLVTAGGRVLTVTAVAPDLGDAQRASAAFAQRVEFAGKHYRTDIAWRERARHARAT